MTGASAGEERSGAVVGDGVDAPPAGGSVDGSGAAVPGPSPVADLLAVEAVDLTRDFDGKRAVDAVNLRVPKGVFFGFLGPNGAGKSTTIRMLTGLLPPTGGTARILGRDPVADPVGVKRILGILPEEIYTYERLTGRELLVFTGRMHGLGPDEAEHRAGDLLDLMEVSATDRDRMLVDYSMGMKKKTLLASAMIHAPRVLFLDEPFNGIDAVTARSIRRVLQRSVDGGVTVFFSSHVLETVERICSLVAIIDGGRILAQGPVDHVRTAAGMEAGATLEEVFVRLVGDRGEPAGLDWLT